MEFGIGDTQVQNVLKSKKEITAELEAGISLVDTKMLSMIATCVQQPFSSLIT